MARVFISYAKEDVVAARRLVRDLRAKPGIEPWLDEESLLPGVDWRDEILRAIETSQFVVILLSSTAVEKTGFVQKELRTALDKLEHYPPGEIYLIPARLDRCEPRFGLLQRLQYVDLFPDWDAGLNRLYDAISLKASDSLSRVFDTIPRFLSARADFISWIGGHLAEIRAMDPSRVIEYLDKKFDKYAEEINALTYILGAIGTSNPQATLMYLLRVDEIGGNCLQYLNEFFKANGLALEGAKVLPLRLRTLFLRNVFDSYVACIESIIGNTYPQCLAFVEITKHYVVQREGRHHGDSEIIKRALKVLRRYDLLFIDIVIFYALRSKNRELLLDVIPHLRNHFTELPDLKQFRGSDFFEINTVSFGDEQRVYRRERAVVCLLRVGTYLSWSDSNEEKKLGQKIWSLALTELKRIAPECAKLLIRVSPAEQREVFEKLETLDYRPPNAFADDSILWEKMLKLMDHPCKVCHGSMGWKNIRIEGNMFGETLEINITFGR